MKVKKLLSMDFFSSLTLICGEGGLENEISSVGIVDYEFSPEAKHDNANTFEQQCFVITSLLYANNDEELLLNSIKELSKAKVSGMAYKNIFYNELPKSVINFANENNFPIFLFGRELYSEDFIFAIMNELNNDNVSILSEEVLENMIADKYQEKEIYIIAKSLPLKFKNNTMGVYVYPITENKDIDMDRIITSYYLSKHLHRKCSIIKYKEGFFIIVTSNQSLDKFDIIINEILEVLRLNQNDYYFCRSNLHNAYTKLDCCIRESYFTHQVTVAENREFTNYDKIGTYKLILPAINHQFIKTISDEYLKPIIDQDIMLETAIAFVQSNCDINKTADKLLYHENTVRYRLAKIKEKLEDNTTTEFEFHQNLIMAVRIKLILATT